MAAAHKNLVLLLNNVKEVKVQCPVSSVKSLWTMIEQPSIYNGVICKLLHCSSPFLLLPFSVCIIPLMKSPRPLCVYMLVDTWHSCLCVFYTA